MDKTCNFGVCRCCYELKYCLNMIKPYEHAGVMENYAEMISETFAIDVKDSSTDSKPLICCECVPRLRDAHAFRAQLQRAQARLQADITKGMLLAGTRTARKGAKAQNQGGTKQGKPHLFQCDTCQKRFKKKERLISHLRSHTGEIPYVLRYRNPTLTQNGSAKTCVETPAPKKVNDDTYYDIPLIRSRLIKTDVMCVISEKPHACLYCNAAFSNVSALKTHLRTHTREKQHVCKYCSAAFSSNTLLQNHLRTHTGEKPYVCKYCNAAFSVKYSLKTHIRTHTGERPYKCSYCKLSFSRNFTLKIHIRTHTKEKRFVCSHCGAAFSVDASLKRHLRTHTGEKPYVCNQCNAAFAYGSVLKEHLRIHTGEKPFACKYCNAAFRAKSSLIQHLLRHTGEKPHVCKYCNAAFRQYITLKRHYKRHEQ